MHSPEERQLISDFQVESREHLSDIESQLLAIEAAGENIDEELVNQVFRAIHSIKGAAGFLGFTTLGALAHNLENVLNLVRSRKLVPETQNVEVMLHAADRLQELLDDIENSNEEVVNDHIEALEAIVRGDYVAAAKAPVDKPPVAEPVSNSVCVTSETSPAEIPVASPSPEIVPAESIASAVESPVTDFDTENNSDETMPAAEAEEVVSSSSYELTEPISESGAMSTTQSYAAENADPAPVTEQTHAVTPSTENAESVHEANHAKSSACGDANIRVSVTVLDRLMNLAGELVLARNQLLQVVNSREKANVDSVAARINQITSELQEAIMQTRMQTVGNVFNKFPRVVRDLSNKLGKQCELIVEGTEVELDKSIIEAIGDPLTHLVRNGVDHGVELPDVRQRNGKQPKGTLTLRAFHQAGKVNITLKDDGQGIDGAKLRSHAVEKGIITQDQAREMSDREALQLIFKPGFSMAKCVTDVSGRGVGMDVVKTNIEKLGGTVNVETQIGQGSTFHVKLPLTLAIIPSLVVRSNNQPFAIPQTSIRELVRIKASEVGNRIQHVKNAEVLRLRGRLLPLVRLNSAMSVANSASSGPETSMAAMNIVVVESGRLHYGLIVDGLHDSEEIVVKPLGRHMQHCSCLSGATILGDGEVALILDVAGIANYTHLTRLDQEEESEAGTEDSAAKSAEDSQVVLLFTNNPHEQFAVPMELISRLERIRADQIDSVGGQEVLQYRGGSLPLLRLENCISASAGPESATLHILVFSVMKREVGLVVPRLVDIREVSVDVDTVTLREQGVIGSIVEDGRATRLLDLYEITQKSHPSWFEVKTEEVKKRASSTTILLAEDSDFFRKQLGGFLTSEGYDVIACEDGAVAWETLQATDKEVSLVISDIEMPRMNGFELCRVIKESPRFQEIPVIAVTSLAGDDDMRHGSQVGFNEYHVKLDRERLLGAVTKLTRKRAASLV